MSPRAEGGMFDRIRRLDTFTTPLHQQRFAKKLTTDRSGRATLLSRRQIEIESMARHLRAVWTESFRGTSVDRITVGKLQRDSTIYRVLPLPRDRRAIFQSLFNSRYFPAGEANS
jgi:hypothetical protein